MLLTLHELQCFLSAYNTNSTCLPLKTDTVALLRHEQHLGPEGRADELARSSLVAVTRNRQTVEMVRDGCAVLRIEVGVDLVKEVEWGRIAGLDGEDECEGTETWHDR